MDINLSYFKYGPTLTLAETGSTEKDNSSRIDGCTTIEKKTHISYVVSAG